MSGTHPLSPNTYLNDAIRLNNSGVADASRGSLDKAIACFSQALHQLKHLIAVDSDSGLPSTGHNHLHTTTTLIPHHREDPDYFIFQSAIALRPRDDSSPADRDHDVYCSVIILNLAVVHHQMALRDNDVSQSNSMFKAQRFYDMVEMILSQNEVGSLNATGLLVRLAALNNLAHIQLQASDFSSSASYFRHMSWLVSQTSLEHQRQQFDSSPEEAIVDGMMLNVLMANRQHIAPAA